MGHGWELWNSWWGGERQGFSLSTVSPVQSRPVLMLGDDSVYECMWLSESGVNLCIHMCEPM